MRGSDLPAGEVGVLVIGGPDRVPRLRLPAPDGRGPSRGDGKVRDGWLDTGDLGSVDADGFVYLTGRAKDLIIRGGHNIDPAGDRGRAARAPGRHRRRGRRPAGPARRRGAGRLRHPRRRRRASPRTSCAPGRTSASPSRAAAPKRVTVVDAIPVTAVGKPFKPALRRLAAEAAARDALAGIATDVAARLAGGQVVVTVRGGDRAAVRDALGPFAFDWETADQEGNR